MTQFSNKYPIDGSRDALWMASATAAPQTEPLLNQIDTDVAIIGAGITGLNAALHLAKTKIDVCVVEAKGLGFGASGRSGGQVNLGLNLSPSELIKRFGKVRGERLVSLVINTPDQVFDWISQNQLNCDPVQQGWIQGAVGRRQMYKLRDLAEDYRLHGSEITLLDAESLKNRSGASGYVGGLYYPRAGSVQPLSYTRELARCAMENGARVFTDSRVNGLNRSANGRWIVKTDSGKLSCREVLICTNGYTDSLCSGLKKTVVPIRSLLVATEPLDNALRQEVLPNQVTFVDKRRLILYFRYDRDGRLCAGDRGPMRDQFRHQDFNDVKQRATSVFPQLKQVRWDYQWGGRVAVTKDSLPFLYKIAPGLTAGMGYNGRGIGMGTMMGRALAQSIAAPEQCEFPETQPNKFLFHKFHAAGASALIKWSALRDHLDSL